MPITLTSDPVACYCCATVEMEIVYAWGSNGSADLDTGTEMLGEVHGWSCANSSPYLDWISSDCTGPTETEPCSQEQVNVKVDTAKADSAWTSSVNIICRAGWYSPVGGSGTADLTVTYNDITLSKSISPGSQSGCASTEVATITVYADGTFDLV